MLLVQITINGVVNYVSLDGHALVHNWKPYVAGFDAPTLGIPSDHGGMAKMTFGSIRFNPRLFASDWPPPASCAITAQYTDTTEAAAETIFTGTCHVKSFNRTEVVYSLSASDYDETLNILTSGTVLNGKQYKIVNYITDDDFTNIGGSNTDGDIFTASGTTPTHWAHSSVLARIFSDTLNNVITEILTGIPEITSVDTTCARASSPNVWWQLDTTRLRAGVASDIAEFYSHLIYIDGATAYLVDMLRDNGTRSLTEFQYFSDPTYEYKDPISEITSTSPLDNQIYSAQSTYKYGRSVSVSAHHIYKTQIEAALADILTVENAPRVCFSIPMIAGNFPKMGEKITIPDTANVANMSSWVRVRKLQYDFSNDTVQIEGEGGIVAT
jgi:hypothetical protein